MSKLILLTLFVFSITTNAFDPDFDLDQFLDNDQTAYDLIAEIQNLREVKNDQCQVYSFGEVFQSDSILAKGIISLVWAYSEFMVSKYNTDISAFEDAFKVFNLRAESLNQASASSLRQAVNQELSTITKRLEKIRSRIIFLKRHIERVVKINQPDFRLKLAKEFVKAWNGKVSAIESMNQLSASEIVSKMKQIISNENSANPIAKETLADMWKVDLDKLRSRGSNIYVSSDGVYNYKKIGDQLINTLERKWALPDAEGIKAIETEIASKNKSIDLIQKRISEIEDLEKKIPTNQRATKVSVEKLAKAMRRIRLFSRIILVGAIGHSIAVASNLAEDADYEQTQTQIKESIKFDQANRRQFYDSIRDSMLEITDRESALAFLNGMVFVLKNSDCID